MQLDTRDRRIAELEEAVRELKRKLNTNSDNSGISPSQDPQRDRRKGGREKAMAFMNALKLGYSRVYA